jgi:hypothetical protein
VREVARCSGLSVSALHFYESEGSIKRWRNGESVALSTRIAAPRGRYQGRAAQRTTRPGTLCYRVVRAHESGAPLVKSSKSDLFLG